MFSHAAPCLPPRCAGAFAAMSQLFAMHDKLVHAVFYTKSNPSPSHISLFLCVHSVNLPRPSSSQTPITLHPPHTKPISKSQTSSQALFAKFKKKTQNLDKKNKKKLTVVSVLPSLSTLQYSLLHFVHVRIYNNLQSPQVYPQPQQSRSRRRRGRRWVLANAAAAPSRGMKRMKVPVGVSTCLKNQNMLVDGWDGVFYILAVSSSSFSSSQREIGNKAMATDRRTTPTYRRTFIPTYQTNRLQTSSHPQDIIRYINPLRL